MDATAILSQVPAILTAIGGLIAAVAAARTANKAEAKAEEAAVDAAKSKMEAAEAQRRAEAAEKAFEFFDAQNRGVVLVATYEAMPAESSAVAWLRACGWTVCEYDMRQYAGRDLPGTVRWQQDLESADVVLLQGSLTDQNERIALDGTFREALRGGAGVLLMVPNREVKYRLELWGETATGVTNARRAESEVRAAVAARRAMQAHQGTSRGGLAAARAALPAA